MPELQIEVNEGFVKANDVLRGPNGAVALITPPLTDEYWLLKVRVSENQAVVGFPKFTTIGVGFQFEEDWNTNLPWSVEAERICDHIFHNAGDPAITRETVIAAIRLIQGHVEANREVFLGRA